MTKDNQRIRISISREHSDTKIDIEKIFEDLNVKIDANLMRFSAEELAMQIVIFLSGAFVGGAAWDLLKLSVKKLFKKYPKVRIVIQDNSSIMYAIKDDFSVSVIVTPDRIKEFEHIRTIDDMIKYLESK